MVPINNQNQEIETFSKTDHDFTLLREAAILYLVCENTPIILAASVIVCLRVLLSSLFICLFGYKKSDM